MKQSIKILTTEGFRSVRKLEDFRLRDMIGANGFGGGGRFGGREVTDANAIRARLGRPNAERIWSQRQHM